MRIPLVNLKLATSLACALGLFAVPTLSSAQPADPPADVPADETPDDLDAPTPMPPDDGGDQAGDQEDPFDSSDPPDMLDMDAPSSLTIHIISTRNTYETMAFDIFDVESRTIVASGVGADEGAGDEAATFELEAGIYKIVRSGEPFDARIDFATVTVDGPTDFVIVIDPDTEAFRGSGLLTDELPEGRTIAGVRISLNVGGTLAFTQTANVIGTTNGTQADLGLFGNFSLVYGEGNHFLKVDSSLNLNLRDQQTSAANPQSDYFEGSALYALNINNDFVGPYARASFRTKIFPGYLYLRDDNLDTGEVRVNFLDGTSETFLFGEEANPDDLRIEVAEPFAPFILQEEIGGNLKAVDLDLKLIKLNVATRIGYGFRQGFTNGLLVVEGDERGTPVELFERDNYFTHGPIIGANGTITFARWLFGTANFAMMAPLQDRSTAGDNFGKRLLIDLSGTGGFKFPALSFFYASFDYSFRLQRDGYLTDDTQFAHTLMARANLQLF